MTPGLGIFSSSIGKQNFLKKTRQNIKTQWMPHSVYLLGFFFIYLFVSMFSGKFVSRIGGGKLLGPKGIAVNSAGNLIVVDNKASCVYVFQGPIV